MVVRDGGIGEGSGRRKSKIERFRGVHSRVLAVWNISVVFAPQRPWATPTLNVRDPLGANVHLSSIETVRSIRHLSNNYESLIDGTSMRYCQRITSSEATRAVNTVGLPLLVTDLHLSLFDFSYH